MTGDAVSRGRVPFWAPTLARLGLDVAPLQAPSVAERLRLEPDALALTDHRHRISAACRLPAP